MAAGDGPLVVSTTALAGTTGEAIALWANNRGAVNRISGSDLGDTITVPLNLDGVHENISFRACKTAERRRAAFEL